MKTILGLDAGSVAVSAVVINSSHQLLRFGYQFHHGVKKKALSDLIEEMTSNTEHPLAIAATTNTPDILPEIGHYTEPFSFLRAAREFHPSLHDLLIVGGSHSHFISLKDDRSLGKLISNASCASGTGSFLDQQAQRLSLNETEILSKLASSNPDSIPTIASRCSVFAKTDLVHAQQEGYNLNQICEGICLGTARNIAAMIPPAETDSPLIFAGGVSRNAAVLRNLSLLLHRKIQVGSYSHLYGALGAAFLLLDALKEELSEIPSPPKKVSCFIPHETVTFHPPLKSSSFSPSFQEVEKFDYVPERGTGPVEIDLYEPFNSLNEVILGLDIGSTSTKAVLLNTQKKILCGFYTRTAGQPLRSFQGIFEAIEWLSRSKAVSFYFLGAGTTGSGRKLIGKVIGADSISDEITAQSKAAFETDPQVDTLIEIGGQDSKFVSIFQGAVHFSSMNHVCAAGTGSFLEEIRLKLKFEEPANMSGPAPTISNRCTVFMERDITQLLNEGYSPEKLMISACHAVCDNYLSKVAVSSLIGKHILFQGATAKNQAFVAAFEQRLSQTILVSPVSHLSGAFGAALIVMERAAGTSHFRGTKIFKESYPVQIRTCSLCENHCKTTLISTHSEKIAYGFLCGREPENKSPFQGTPFKSTLIREHERCTHPDNLPQQFRDAPAILLPWGLYFSEHRNFWHHFFNTLRIRTESLKPRVLKQEGPCTLPNSNYCSPMMSFINQLKHANKQGILFLPNYCYGNREERNRFYCYTSQFASPIASLSLKFKIRTLSPQITASRFATKLTLHKVLKTILPLCFEEISQAYEKALIFHNKTQLELRKYYFKNRNLHGEIDLLLLGRPYLVLEESINKHIPRIIENHNAGVFFQDMMDLDHFRFKEISSFLESNHWIYPGRILKSALFAAKTKNLYPVYMTTFRCAPDSFTLEHFKNIMEIHKKPYLILELDEHGSNIGYETRIEAALASFRRHHQSFKSELPPSSSSPNLNPKTSPCLKGKTLLIPSWDDFLVKFLEAIWIRHGIDARIVPLKAESLKKGGGANTGQCLPLNLIHQSVCDYIQTHKLSPDKTSVWTLLSSLPCNIHMFSPMLISLFKKSGFNGIDIYPGTISMKDLSLKSGIDAYFAYLLSGLLRKTGCRLRPYETVKGSTDTALLQAKALFYDVFLGKRNRNSALEEVLQILESVKTQIYSKPKIAVFGDIYVRDNETLNQHLIETIEQAGGEVIVTTFTELSDLVSNYYLKRWISEGYFKEVAATKALLLLGRFMKRKAIHGFRKLLRESLSPLEADAIKVMKTYALGPLHCGETVDNLIKIEALLNRHPDISLFVQAIPSFCCAGAVTETLIRKLETRSKVPFVTLTYDGTEENQNVQILPYLESLLLEKGKGKNPAYL